MIYQIKAKGLTLTANTKGIKPTLGKSLPGGAKVGTMYEVDGYKFFIFEPEDNKGYYVIDSEEKCMAHDMYSDTTEFEEALKLLKEAEEMYGDVKSFPWS